jgi:hypothetical protein
MRYAPSFCVFDPPLILHRSLIIYFLARPQLLTRVQALPMGGISDLSGILLPIGQSTDTHGALFARRKGSP